MHNNCYYHPWLCHSQTMQPLVNPLEPQFPLVQNGTIIERI